MSDDDPFAEPDDTEKTIVNLRPGGRAPAPQQPAQPPQYAPPPQQQYAPPPQQYQPPPQQQYQPPPQQGGFGQQPGYPPQQPAFGQQPVAQQPQAPQQRKPEDGGFALTGMNPLNAAASQIFALIGRIRNRAQHNDPAALRTAVVSEIQQFEQRCLHQGIPAQSVNIARYALCATIDDVVLNTPWGGRSIWTTQSMVGTFHKETHGGDRFFDLLARMEQEPSVNLDMLEFIYVCLSLGFEGRLRVEHGGTDKHMRIRENLARLIRSHRGDQEHALSPFWKGLKVAHRALNIWLPLWIITAFLAVVLGGAYFGLTFALNGNTERLQGTIAQIGTPSPIELTRLAPPPPPPPPAPETEERIDRVTGFLEDEIAEGVVEVIEQGNTLIIRIAGAEMFGAGSDSLQAGYPERLNKVANALNDEIGAIIVAGHSDNDPISTARFPSNQILSLRRAEAVLAAIAGSMDDPSRLTPEGRADREPLVENSSRANKAKNRRVEVILVR
ncbi:MAG: type IVB secretion system protein IcmH/DotU [Rhodobacteraceae bacterium]|nr:type IVB secretion system protein IcmH/DotU [Paracoccaceae bacterium]